MDKKFTVNDMDLLAVATYFASNISATMSHGLLRTVVVGFGKIETTNDEHQMVQLFALGCTHIGPNPISKNVTYASTKKSVASLFI